MEESVVWKGLGWRVGWGGGRGWRSQYCGRGWGGGVEGWGGGEGGGVSSVEEVGVEESVVWKRLGWRSQ